MGHREVEIQAVIKALLDNGLGFNDLDRYGYDPDQMRCYALDILQAIENARNISFHRLPLA